MVVALLRGGPRAAQIVPRLSPAPRPGRLPPPQPGGAVFLASPVSGDLLPQRDDLLRPGDPGAGSGSPGGVPGAGRLSLCRSRGEPDAGFARARIRAAGGVSDGVETRGHMEQIVVGMADCRIGDAPGQVLATYALGSCIGL